MGHLNESRHLLKSNWKPQKPTCFFHKKTKNIMQYFTFIDLIWVIFLIDYGNQGLVRKNQSCNQKNLNTILKQGH